MVDEWCGSSHIHSGVFKGGAWCDAPLPLARPWKKFTGNFKKTVHICGFHWTSKSQKCFSFRRASPPDPLTKGSASGPHCMGLTLRAFAWNAPLVQICGFHWTSKSQKCFSFWGFHSPDPLIRGSAPGPHCIGLTLRALAWNAPPWQILNTPLHIRYTNDVFSPHS